MVVGNVLRGGSGNHHPPPKNPINFGREEFILMVKG